MFVFNRNKFLVILFFGVISSSLYSQNIIRIGASQTNKTIDQALTTLGGTTITQPQLLLLQADYNSSLETIPLNISAQPGASATRTITIKPDVGVTKTISGSVDGGAVIKFRGASFFIIDGSNTTNGTSRDLTIINTSNNSVDFENDKNYNSNSVIWVSTNALGAPSRNNTVKNCKVQGYRNGSALTVITGILVHGPTWLPSPDDTSEAQYFAYDNAFNTVIQNNEITNIRVCGIAAIGLGFGRRDTGLVVNNNIVGSANVSGSGPRWFGIYIVRQNKARVSNNEIVGMSFPASESEKIDNSLFNQKSFGLVCFINTNCQFNNNLIHNISNFKNNTQMFGIYNNQNFYLQQYGNIPTNNIFFNNAVYDIQYAANSASGGTTIINGIYHAGGWADKFIFNSVNIVGPFGNANKPSVAFYLGSRNSSSSTLNDLTEVRNNIFATDSFNSSGPLYCIFVSGGFPNASFSNFSNNIYSFATRSTNFVGTINGINYQTFANWRTRVGATNDLNSLNVNPQYISRTNLNLRTTSPAKMAAIPSNGITYDILNTSRNAFTPTIGAYESNFIVPYIKNAYPIILYTQKDTLSVVGSRLNSIRLTRFPDSFTIFNFVSKQLISGTDTLYKILLPATARNGLYIVRGFDNINTVADGYRLVRLFNFPIDSVYVRSWGLNEYGQYSRPETQPNIVDLALGSGHRIMLRKNGTIVAQGLNNNNQLPNPNSIDSVVQIVAGLNHTILLRTNGVAHVYGSQTNIPSDSTGNYDVAAGLLHSLYLKSNGSVVSFGNNGSGQATTPFGLSAIQAIAAGGYHSLSTNNIGQIIGWGLNSFGQLNPVPLLNNNTDAISGGNIHSTSLKTSKLVIGFGNNSDAQITIPSGLGSVNYINNGAYFSNSLNSANIFAAWGAKGYDTLNLYPKKGGITYTAVTNFLDSFNYQPDVVALGKSTPYLYNSVIQRLFISTSVVNGIISPKVYVKWGDSVRITYAPFSGGFLDSIFIDSVYVGKDSLKGYTFRNIIQSHSIRVIFNDTPSPFYIKQPDTNKIYLCPNVLDTSKKITIRVIADSGYDLSVKLKSYQWFRNYKSDTINGTAVPGASGLLSTFDTTLIFYPPSNVFYDSSFYYVKVYNIYNTYRYSKVSGAVITSRPQVNWVFNNNVFSGCVPANDTAYLRIGFMPLWPNDSISWNLFQNTLPTRIGSNLLNKNATSPAPSYNFITQGIFINAPQTRYYFISFKNRYGCTDTTSYFNFQWINYINLTTINLKDTIYCLGAATKPLVISAKRDTNTVRFMWYINNIPSYNGATILSGNDSTFRPFSVPSSLVKDSMWYFVVVTDKTGLCKGDTSDISGKITITYPKIILQPSLTPRKYCQFQPEDSLFIRVNAYWTNLVDVFWYKISTSNPNNRILVGSGFSFKPDSSIYDSAYYFAVVRSKISSGCPNLTDTSALSGLYVNAPIPIITNTLRDTSFCNQTGNVAYQLNISSPWATTYQFQWYENFNRTVYSGTIRTADTFFSVLIPNQLDTHYYYGVVMNGFGCSDTSNIARIVVLRTPMDQGIGFVLNKNQTLLCIPFGDTARVSIKLNNPNNFPLTWDLFKDTINAYSGTILNRFPTSLTDSFVSDTIHITQPITYYFYTKYQNQFGCRDSSTIVGIQWYKSTKITTINLNGAIYCSGAVSIPLIVSLGGLFDTSRVYFDWYGNNKPNYNSIFKVNNSNDSFFYPPTIVSGFIRDTMYYFVIVRDKNFVCTSDTSSLSQAIIISDPIFLDTPRIGLSRTCLNNSHDTLKVNLSSYWSSRVNYVWYRYRQTVGGIYIGDSVYNDSFYKPPSTIPDTPFYYVVVSPKTLGCQNNKDTSLLSPPIITFPYPIITGLFNNIYTCIRRSFDTVKARYQYLWSMDTLNFSWYSNSTSSLTGSVLRQSAKDSIFNISTINQDSIYYYYIVKNSQGCADTSNIGLYVYGRSPLKSGDSIILNNNKFRLCLSSSPQQISVRIKNPNTLPYKWSFYSNTLNSYSGANILSTSILSSQPFDTTFQTNSFNIFIPQSRYYYIIIKNDSGCADTTAITRIEWAQLINPDTINFNSRTYCLGDSSVALKISIKDTTAVNYEWYYNTTKSYVGATLISNAQDSFYFPITSSKRFDDTTYYFAIVFYRNQPLCNFIMSPISEAIIVQHFLDSPNISSAPQTTCLNIGFDSNLKVNVQNKWKGSVNYQWYQKTIPGSITTLISSDSILYPPYNVADSFYYFVIVSGKPGSLCQSSRDTSNQSGQWKTYPKPTTSTLRDTSVCVNPGNITLSVNPMSSWGLGISFDWFKNTVQNYNGTIVAGSNGMNTITISKAIVDSAFYYVVTTNSVGCKDTSNISRNYFTPYPVIIDTLKGRVGCKLMIFDTVTANISYNFPRTKVRYLWYYDTVNMVRPENILIQDSVLNRFDVSKILIDTFYLYYIVTNEAGCADTSNFGKYLNSISPFQQQILPFFNNNQTKFCLNTTIKQTVFVKIINQNYIAYTWSLYINNINSISGASKLNTTQGMAPLDTTIFTSDSFTISNAAIRYFFTEISNGTCTDTSLITPIEWSQLLNIVTINLADTSYCLGAVSKPLVISAQGKDTSTLMYSWYVNDQNSYLGARLLTTTQDSFYAPLTNSKRLFDSAYYFVVVNYKYQLCNPTTSAISGLIEIRNPLLSNKIDSNNYSTCFGIPFDSTLKVRLDKNWFGMVNYSWYQKKVTSPIAILVSTDSLFKPPVNMADSAYYFVVVSGNPATICENSKDTSLLSGLWKTYPAPTILNTLPDSSVCINTPTIALTINLTTPWLLANKVYWYKNSLSSFNGSLVDSLKSIFMISTTTPDSSYYYAIAINSKGCRDTTNVSHIFIYPYPIITDTLTNRQSCKRMPTDTAKATFQYLWSQDSVNISWFTNPIKSISGSNLVQQSTNKVFSIFNVVQDTFYLYYIVKNKAGCADTSNISLVEYRKSPLNLGDTIIINRNQTIYCLNTIDSQLIVVQIKNTYNLPYQWSLYQNNTFSYFGATLIPTTQQLSPLDTSFYLSNKFKINTAQTRYYYALIRNNIGCVDTTPIRAIQWTPLINVATLNLAGAIYCQDYPAVPLAINALGKDTAQIIYQWFANNKPSYTGASLILNANDSFYFPLTSVKRYADSTYYFVVVSYRNQKCDPITSAISGLIEVRHPLVILNIDSLIHTTCLNIPYNTQLRAQLNSSFVGQVNFRWYQQISSIAGFSLVSFDSVLTPPSNISDSFYYFVIVSGNPGTICENSSDTSRYSGLWITYPNPSVSNIQNLNICRNSLNNNLTVTTSSPWGLAAKLYWYKNNVQQFNGGLFDSTSTIPINTNLINTSYYYAIITNSKGCADTSNISQVNINPRPRDQIDSTRAAVVEKCVPQQDSVIIFNHIYFKLLPTNFMQKFYINNNPTYNGQLLSLDSTKGTTLDSVYYYKKYFINSVQTQYFYSILTNSFSCTDSTPIQAIIWYDKIQAVLVQNIDTIYCRGALAKPYIVTNRLALDTNVIKYSWYFNSQPSFMGSMLINTTNDSTIIPSTNPLFLPSDTTYYFVVLSDKAGYCKSDTLGLINPLKIRYPKFDNNISTNSYSGCQYDPTTALRVTINSTWTAKISYNWYKVSSSLFNNPILQSTDSIFVPSSNNYDSSRYYVVVTTLNSSVCPNLTDTSNKSGLYIIYPQPVIKNMLRDTTVCNGTNPIVFNSAAALVWNLPISYSWYRTTSKVNYAGVLISGANDSLFQVPQMVGNQYFYSVVRNSFNCQVNSTIAMVTTNLRPNEQGINIDINHGNNLICIPFKDSTIISLIITNPQSVSYNLNLYRSNVSMYSGNMITLYNTSNPDSFVSGNLGVTMPMINYFYAIYANGFGCFDTTKILKVEWFKAVDIDTVKLEGATYCRYATPSPLVISKRNFFNPDQILLNWYGNSLPSINGSFLVQQSIDSFYYPNTSANAPFSNNMYYYVIAQDLNFQCVGDTSNFSQVIIIDYPQITIQPSTNNSSVCQGGFHNPLFVKVNQSWEGQVNFAWYRIPFSGGAAMLVSTDSIFIPQSQVADSSYYFCVITSKIESRCSDYKDTSARSGLIITNPNPTILQPILDTNFCHISSAVFASVNILSLPNVTQSYQWYYSNDPSVYTNSYPLINETNELLNINRDTGQSYYYVVIANNYGCIQTSNIFGVRVYPTLRDQNVQTVVNDNNLLLCVPIFDTAILSLMVENPLHIPYALNFYQNNINGYSNAFPIGLNQIMLDNYESDPIFVSTPLSRYYFGVFTSVDNCIDTTSIYKIQWYQAIKLGVINLFGNEYCKGFPSNPLVVTSLGSFDTSFVSYNWYGTPINNYAFGNKIITGNDSFYYPSTTPGGNIQDTMYYYVVAVNKTFECASDTSPLSGQIIINYPKFIQSPTSNNGLYYSCLNTPHDSLFVSLNGDWESRVSYSWYKTEIPNFSQGSGILVGTNQSYLPPSNIPDTSYYYVVVQVNSGKCIGQYDTSLFSNVVITYPIPQINLGLQNIDTCFKSGMVILNSGVNYPWLDPILYSWYVNPTSPSYSSSLMPIIQTYSDMFDLSRITQSYPYYIYYKAANSFGCSDSSNIISVNIKSPPFAQQINIVVNDGNSRLCLKVADSNQVKIQIQNLQNIAFTWKLFVDSLPRFNKGVLVNTTQNMLPLDTTVWFTSSFKFNEPTQRYFYAVIKNNNNCYDTTRLNIIEWYKLIKIIGSNLPGGSYCRNETNTLPLSFSINKTQNILLYQWYFNSQPNYKNAQLIPNATDTFIYPTTNPKIFNADTGYYFAVIHDSNYVCAADTTPISSKVIIIYPKITTNLDTAENAICVNQPQKTFTLQTNPVWQNNIRTFWYKTSQPNFNSSTLVSQNSLTYTPQNALPDSAYYYAVTVALSPCPNTKDTSNLSGLYLNYPYPLIVNKLNDSMFCFGNQAALLRLFNYYPWSDNLTYQWYNNDSRTTTNAILIPGAQTASYLPINLSPDTSYYFAIVRNSIGCSSTSNIARVAINAIPSQLGVRALLNDSNNNLCEGNNDSNFITVRFTNVNGVKFSWQLYKNTNNFYTGSILPTTATSNPNIFNSYKFSSPENRFLYFYINIQLPNGCMERYTPLRVQFLPLTKILNTQLAAATYCRLSISDTLKIFSTNSDTSQIFYQWYATLDSMYGSGVLIPNAMFDYYLPSTNIDYPAGPKTYYYAVVADKNKNCKSISSNISGLIDIVYPQIRSVLNGQATNRCIGIDFDTLTTQLISDWNINEVQFDWYQTKTRSTQNGTLIDTNYKFLPSSSSVDTFYYYIITTSKTICALTQDTSKILGPFITYPIPIITKVLNDTNFCKAVANSEVAANVSYNYNDTLTYSWFRTPDLDTANATLLGTTQKLYFNLPTSIGPYNYFYRVSNTIGCEAVSSVAHLTINPQPIITIDTLFVRTVVLPGTPFRVIGRGAPILNWTPKNLVIPNQSFNNEAVILTVNTKTTFTASGATDLGCIDSANVIISILDSDIDIYPTKVITPNFDGINDFWKIYNIEYFPENKLEIYNELNIIVQSFTNFNSKSKWYATSTYNSQLQNGEYFYIITLYRNGKYLRQKKGNIIIRNSE